MILYIYLTDILYLIDIHISNWYTLLTQFISTVGVLSRNVTRDNSPSAHLPIQPSIHPNYRSGCSKQLSTLQNWFNTTKSDHTIPNWLLVSLSPVFVKFLSSNVFEYQISLVIASLNRSNVIHFAIIWPIQAAFLLLTWSISNTVLHSSKMILLKLYAYDL